jgi:hypothetical protein
LETLRHLESQPRQIAPQTSVTAFLAALHRLTTSFLPRRLKLGFGPARKRLRSPLADAAGAILHRLIYIPATAKSSP